MSNYTKHLEDMYSSKTFRRKVNYFKYNFSEILADISVNNFSVLEIGPGMGESISFLNHLGVKKIDIVDNDREILRNLKRRFKLRKTTLTTDMLKLGNEANRYDMIIMIQVLEHIPLNSQAKVIDNLYSYLKKGGTIVVVVPNANNPLGLVERYGDLQHTSAFTTQSLFDLVEKSGIKKYKLKISGFEIPPYDLINIFRIGLQKAFHLFLLLLMIVNGGTFFKVMTPNITLHIKKEI